MDRYEGFLAALKDAGIPSENLVRWIPEGLDLPPAVFGQIVQDTMQGLRQRGNPVSAVFCVEDRVGCAVVAACEQLGIRLPHNLEIATFNDWHPMTLRTPWNIHRVIQRKYELGHTAAGLLLDRIAEPAQPARTVLVPADLILADAGLEESFVSPSPNAIQYPEGLVP
jgi:DNA-binding LacI/PurR family transcriptional regulator